MSNYNAIIAKITKIQPIPKADFIQSALVLGEWIIVNISHKVGDIGVFFPVGCALSPDMCHHGNLYRKSEMNNDQTKSGFLEANGRIVAMKMRGTMSTGLFLPMACLTWTGHPIDKLTLGTSFSGLGGHEICSRYNPPAPQNSQGGGNKTKGKTTPKFTAPYFEKHIDTNQFKYEVGKIQKGSTLYFHAKFHGTSARQSHTKVENNLPNWKLKLNRLANKIGLNEFFPTYEYKMVIGSRNVLIKNNDSGFYGSNEFRYKAAEAIAPHLGKGVTVYSELVGFTHGGATIMPQHNVTKIGDKKMVKKYGETVDYTYGCVEGTLRNIVYRVTITTDDGLTVDLPQKAMEMWCSQRDLEHTLEIHPPIIYDGDEDALRELVDRLTERPDVMTECYDSPTQIGEGIIIREECGTLVPRFYKSKSFYFRLLEGHNVEADLEETS